MNEKPKGIDSGMAILEDMFQRGEIDEETRARLARQHLAEVFGMLATEPNRPATEEPR